MSKPNPYQHAHVPERLEGESFEAYQSRREWSRTINRLMRNGTSNGVTFTRAKRERRAAIKAAGSFRQFKRQQYEKRSLAAFHKGMEAARVAV